jgi:hypothetical protein
MAAVAETAEPVAVAPAAVELAAAEPVGVAAADDSAYALKTAYFFSTAVPKAPRFLFAASRATIAAS